MIKAVQVEQEGMAANVAMSAQLRSQQSGAGGGGHGVDSSTLQLVMGTEERFQKHLTKLNEVVHNTIADLDAAKVKYDTNLDMVQATFEQLHARLNNMEGSSGDSRISTFARMTELRELENHMMDRMRIQAEAADKMNRTINQLVTDVERVANSHNSSEQARAANAAGGRGGGGGLSVESLHLLEQRVEARLALLATQYVTVEALREWEVRFATVEAVRAAGDKARANDEVRAAPRRANQGPACPPSHAARRASPATWPFFLLCRSSSRRSRRWTASCTRSWRSASKSCCA